MFPSHSLRLQSLQPQDLLDCLAPYRQAKRWLIAYSGGVDSHVLLHLMTQLYQLPGCSERELPRLEAIHINHQLQEGAQQWAKHCEQQAGLLGVPILVRCVDVVCLARESIEDKARQARYQCIESLVQADDVVLMGHHLDDQVETLFLRLLRGSGSRGMAAMPHSRRLGYACLFRPFLDIDRSTIEHYAGQHNLSWVEDPSNQQCDYDRNFLRLQILPLLAKRWPGYQKTLARTALHNEESSILNTELAELDFHSLGISSQSESIALPLLAQLSVARKKNLLRHWLFSRGLPLPTAAQLQTVLDQVIGAKPDADPLVRWSMTSNQAEECSAVEVRRFRDELYVMTRLPDLDGRAIYPWDPSQVLEIKGAGSLLAKPVLGAGLRACQHLSIQFRQGGERCQPSGRAGSQTLKKLFQEYAVPTWLRDRVPIIYVEGVLAAVGDLWICDGFTAVGEESGLELTWRKP
ncbi:MAG: tRNA lysidine(34) synthetase TilS [Spongiibacteraceae bacterium]|nr:tRNA lysidine(34) synthetase TilS [Spongiibacteraceae bacterium]MBN4055602.1 tRNA lysidine(34) synthetase TilS [bacterium AH-315-K03]